MNGIIVSLLVETGEQVDKGDALMVMEAMKMEHTIRAPSAGSVSQFNCSPGDRVDGNAKLIDFDASS
jgi:3-methylcrotonyl-CoA carboxylase alpha subunit